MCGVDWQHEAYAIPTKAYPTIQSLKRERPCVKGCGVVELEVREVGWPQPQRLGRGGMRFDDYEALQASKAYQAATKRIWDTYRRLHELEKKQHELAREILRRKRGRS